MKPIMDTVLNHRTATYKATCNNDWVNFTNPNWGPWAVVNNDYGILTNYISSLVYTHTNITIIKK